MNNLPKKGTKFEEKYEIQEILGTGGIGTVSKALQLDCGRIVALKILLKSDLDNDTRTRFLREAQALSKLSHRNIMAVYNMGIGTGGLPYLVMEYVVGQSLRGLINSLGQVPVLQSLRIIR
ncbi:MAG: protein kinase, partial [Candidatus Obscuribacterales bacterium]|nr:protein kinase [Candidatus Obscuribacterales bacterium]